MGFGVGGGLWCVCVCLEQDAKKFFYFRDAKKNFFINIKFNIRKDDFNNYYRKNRPI